ncbi:MAG: hypothetical protein CFE23_03875 [Flavobacterium sp. BFFFF1]|uniref:lipoprotein n=1 Tax=Flavobacterium sp. BFFFF1 TaxID=2015557 RepID=UPI000BC54D71|nr:lipoprotein [Flavobacterium sp. BFFFF1]OYU81619.1 MAG: hypothetical protein CFE23_03875 [Flavobacterium sp. BFFFF1]
MKKSIYILFFGAALALSSCNENDKNTGRFDDADPSSGWVQFVDGSAKEFVYEGASVISLPIVLNAPVNADGIDVNYTITDVSGSSVGIIPERSGVAQIYKDQFGEATRNGNLMINIAEAALTASTEFDVTLTSTSKSSVQIGLPDNSRPTVVRVKICPVNIGTTYAGTAEASTGFVGPAFTQTLVPVAGNPRQFTTASAWGVGFVPAITGNAAAIRDYPATITVNDDYSVTVVGINSAAFPNRYLGGEGTYDPCSDTFDLVLRQGIFTNPFTVNVIYSPVGN